MTLQDKDFYRVKEICSAMNISRMALWKKIKSGQAPELEKLNSRFAGYTKETLVNLLNGLQSLQSRRKKL